MNPPPSNINHDWKGSSYIIQKPRCGCWWSPVAASSSSRSRRDGMGAGGGRQRELADGLVRASWTPVRSEQGEAGQVTTDKNQCKAHPRPHRFLHLCIIQLSLWKSLFLWFLIEIRKKFLLEEWVNKWSRCGCIVLMNLALVPCTSSLTLPSFVETRECTYITSILTSPKFIPPVEDTTNLILNSTKSLLHCIEDHQRG